MTNLTAVLTFTFLTNWVDVPMTGGPAMQVAVVTRDTYASTVFEGVTNRWLIQSKVVGQPSVREKPSTPGVITLTHFPTNIYFGQGWYIQTNAILEDNMLPPPR